MKTFGLIVIFGLMVWSWSAFYSPTKGVSEQTMIEIQNSLQDQMLQVMAQSSSKLNNIVFKQFWTKQISDEQVKAQFVIAFDEESGSEDSDEGAAKTEEVTDATSEKSTEKEDSLDEDDEVATTKVERKGHVILVKADESDNEQVWIIESIKIDGETIEFQKGLKFTSKAQN